jgi:Tol biopolymer transport system component
VIRFRSTAVRPFLPRAAVAVLAALPAAVCAQSAPTLPLAPLRTVTISTTEGTWMGLDVSPDGRTIAFELLGNIFTLPITGGRARQLTEGPAFHEGPQFSPDGRFLVFTSDRGGYNQLWRMPVGGGVPQFVPARDTAGYRLEREGVMPSFDTTAAVYRAPGGRYEIRKWDAQRPPQYTYRGNCIPRDFVLTDWVTGTEQRLASAGADCGIGIMPASAFTPDGRAFITAHSGKLWRIAVPSGTTTEIPFRAEVRLRIRPRTPFVHRVPEDSLVHARRLAGATLSPDRSRVAFGAFNRIWVATLPKGTPKRLTSLAVGEFWPTWSPDGQYIAFVTWTDAGGGEGAIYRMRADGSGAPERLTREPGLYAGLTYSSDGTKVFAVIHPLREAQQSDLDVTWEVRGAEIVSVPVTGGATTTYNRSNWKKGNTWARHTGLQILPGAGSGAADQVARFEALLELWSPLSPGDGKPRLAGAVLTTATDNPGAAMDTALKVMAPPVRDRPSHYHPWYLLLENVVEDIVLSPTRDRALVVTDTRELFLVDVPAKPGDAPPTVVLDPASPQVRLITPLASGAESPQWQPDGRAFTYVFGNTVYRYELPAAGGAALKPTAVTFDVTAPRDLPKGTLALRGARLITMRGNEVIERGDLVIRDRRIVGLGPAGTVPIPQDAHVVDVAGKTIMPGLVDLHDHNTSMRAVVRSRVWQWEANLGYGLLTSRDPQEGSALFLSYEDQLATGELLGLRYMNTGPGLGLPARDPITSMDDARQVIARYADVYRVGNLKEYITTRREVRQWLVMAAAERKLNIASHGQLRHQLVQNAIDGYEGWDHLSLIPVPLYRDIRQLLALTGLTLAHANWYQLQPYFISHLSAAERAKMARLSSPSNFVSWTDGLRPGTESYELAASPNWRQHANLAQLVAEGGRVAAGAHGEPTGIGTHMQFWAYVEGGMPALEALRAGTLRGAEALGLDRDLGSLEAGKLGDVLILDQNPLENIRHTNTIRSIVFNGRLRDASTLDELWPRQRSNAAAWWTPRN